MRTAAVDQRITGRAAGRAAWAIGTLGILAVAACETYSAPNIREPYEAVGSREVAVEACQDRTGLAAARDLATEGTTALRAKLTESRLFEVRDGAPLMVSCDVERFVEGSAFKRWLLPGWGATQATVKVAIWRMPEQEIVATFQSKAQVSAGGLYTVGAEDYIVDVAMGDIVKQMEAWAGGDAGASTD